MVQFETKKADTLRDGDVVLFDGIEVLVCDPRMSPRTGFHDKDRVVFNMIAMDLSNEDRDGELVRLGADSTIPARPFSLEEDAIFPEDMDEEVAA